MIVTKSILHEDFSRDNHWARIYFESDDTRKKSAVLICASDEYLWDIYKARTFSEVKLAEWYKKVIDKWNQQGDKIFEKEIHYDVYANTEEGKINGLDFLKNTIKK